MRVGRPAPCRVRALRWTPVRLMTLVMCVASSLLPACPAPEHGERACAADRDCDVGVCAAQIAPQPVDLEPLPLICVETTSTQDTPCCQSSNQCARGICLVSGACASPCIDASDCATSERCAPVYARVADDALQTLLACVSRVELPSDVSVTESLIEDAIADASMDVTLDLPATDGTLLFVIEHRDEALWPLTSECRTPLCIRALATASSPSVSLFDATFDPVLGPAPLNTVNTSADSFVSTILLPNGPRAVTSSEGYRATLRSESIGDVAVTHMARTQRGARLDLHLHYVGAAGLRPEGARGPALIADALSQVEATFAQADVTLGDVCQTEVVGALAERLGTIDRPRFGLLIELPELLALSAGAQGSALHVFLVDQADVALGISGGLPGPAGMHGTGSSGVVMSVGLIDNPTQLARALAHEMGHYLGLFHAIESDDAVLDPLPDTPRDSSNLMFWSGTQGGELTDNQCDVIASSPMLQ